MTTDVGDDLLIDQALQGNTEAFGRLVTRYQDRLLNAMAHVCASIEDARDVVQDAFVHAFVKLESFRRTSAFYTWLYRIAFNVAVSQRRRAKPCLSVDHHREASGEEVLDRHAPPHARIEQQESADRVALALAALSEEHRTVLVLREMEDCSYETIAEILALPIGTVRSRLHRARLELRELLKEVLEVDGD